MWGLWQLPCFFLALVDLFISSLSSRYSRSRLLLVFYLILSSLPSLLSSILSSRGWFGWLRLPIPGKEIWLIGPPQRCSPFGPISQEWSGRIMWYNQLSVGVTSVGSGRREELLRAGRLLSRQISQKLSPPCLSLIIIPFQMFSNLPLSICVVIRFFVSTFQIHFAIHFQTYLIVY